MKRVQFLLLLILTAYLSFAQSVGIGTNSPNTKAILDINSTTKGLLIPSMTSIQRGAITTPPNGLIVYDTDKNEFYHSNAGSWSPLLNGDYWSRPIASRKRISNSNDSVGIGTIAPTEWLDVAGNIRSRNNISAENNIVASAAVQGATLIAINNMTVGGTGFVNGDLQTNSDLNINNAAAIVQLKNGGVSKGFFQLSNNDIRTGTNSGNTGGKFIIRMNGFNQVYVHENGYVSIGTADYAGGYRLSVNGKAICEELKVQLSGSWPDYVFEKKYKLLPLSSLEDFIAVNKHLPNIPAADEVKKNGIEVGDMQKRMMEKIEELTLYIIDLQKQVNELKKK